MACYGQEPAAIQIFIFFTFPSFLRLVLTPYPITFILDQGVESLPSGSESVQLLSNLSIWRPGSWCFAAPMTIQFRETLSSPGAAFTLKNHIAQFSIEVQKLTAWRLVKSRAHPAYAFVLHPSLRASRRSGAARIRHRTIGAGAWSDLSMLIPCFTSLRYTLGSSFQVQHRVDTLSQASHQRRMQ
ncbi:hypothetical protein EV421DRAFT_1445749 [Armillaria borealis]|uniref:Uncharacterized protein n=1 Tax=Armillaria borealis TaxID=47425 RepID=A0AA39J0F1_9AGAR|nr:hypothetical protein EV421DRAFT_1445749 [Armillaria borealis]